MVILFKFHLNKGSIQSIHCTMFTKNNINPYTCLVLKGLALFLPKSSEKQPLPNAR